MSTGFYRKSRPRPDGTVGYSGYDHADSIADAVEAYKRCRTAKYFILTDDSPDLATLRCTCGALLSDPDADGKLDGGNRCQYVKRLGTPWVIGQHYACSWGTLFVAIGTSDTLVEAGRKLAAAETGGWRPAR
jgi:hypothetical protein